MPSTYDPWGLAHRQLALDVEATARFPTLLARKRARQLASPHALMRGAAPLFYEILASYPELASGPPGEGALVGDMHLENVGAYRNDVDDVVFDLNDFDDAGVGPFRLDVLRLATSVLLAGPSFRASGKEAIALARRMVDAYVGAACEGASPPPVPPVVSELIVRATARSRHDLLDQRAPKDHYGKRSFARGDRYLDLPAVVASEASGLLGGYVRALGDSAPSRAAAWTVVDAAQRVAGTGSLGKLRVALLVRGDAGPERIVELKEAAAPSLARLVQQPPHVSEAHRVVEVARALVAAPPRHTAPVVHGARAFVGRRLRPEEDKLDLGPLHVGAKLDALVAFVGHLLGAAHARAATTRPSAPWTPADRDGLIDRAVELAGLHEAVYLAYARRA